MTVSFMVIVGKRPANLVLDIIMVLHLFGGVLHSRSCYTPVVNKGQCLIVMAITAESTESDEQHNVVSSAYISIVASSRLDVASGLLVYKLNSISPLYGAFCLSNNLSAKARDPPFLTPKL